MNILSRLIQKVNRTLTEAGNYQAMDLEYQVFNDLKRHEGCRLKVYRDTVGVWTIGYGHTKGIHEGTKPITQEQAEEWLKEDMQIGFDIARKVFRGYPDMDKVRKSVLVNMAFNLGETNLRKFFTFFRRLQEQNYEGAALQMLDSKWATQVGQRAVELAKRMSSGKIETRHLVA
jgi:lysozyme